MYNVQIRELMMRKSLMMIVNHITTFQIVSFVNDYPGANRFQDTKTIYFVHSKDLQISSQLLTHIKSNCPR